MWPWQSQDDYRVRVMGGIHSRENLGTEGQHYKSILGK